MKIYLLSLFTAAALCAGCAETHSTSMGASGALGTVCNDGTVLQPNSSCKIHGGIHNGPSSSSGPSTSTR